MREVNFSVPSANRASTGITTALYDRRALDCTSTLPLINSLNHLAYLTLSSPRIRQILTLDGGVERLVSMLKKGKSRNMLDNWKWHLALQCVVNIGVRGSDARASDAQGSESIRTRVVEADIVPVIATVLYNYMQGIENRSRFKQREDEVKLEIPDRRRSPHSHSHQQREDENAAASTDSRRAPPPPIQIPQDNLPVFNGIAAQHSDSQLASPNTQTMPITSPSDQMLFVPDGQAQHHQERRRRHHHRQTRSEALSLFEASSPIESVNPAQNNFHDRDGRPFPTISGPHRTDEGSSQPDTPTTPTARTRTTNRRRSISTSGAQVPRNLRQTSSMSGDSDEGEQTGETSATEAAVHDSDRENVLQAHATMDIEMDVQPNMLDGTEGEEGFADPQVTGDEENETFNIRHRSVDGSLVETNAQQVNATFTPVGVMVDPAGGPDNSRVMIPPAAPLPQDPMLNMAPVNNFGRGTQEDVAGSGLLAWTPHDEEVTMSLQLLAYVSKYCSLRSYFQNSHLVPSLKIRPETMNGEEIDQATAEAIALEQDNEYCQPDDFNIFPLVEKFTLRHYSNDMKYWACVVMRNLCRKDKNRGDIRQCAYYKCGKWEEYARQFAKCRRCRQTKYCSKDCQKSAWVYHRHWCEPARETSGRHSHAHEHGHGHSHHHSHAH